MITIHFQSDPKSLQFQSFIINREVLLSLICVARTSRG